MKRVICLVGLPGSGKSTVAKFLEAAQGSRSFHLPAVVGHLVPLEVREAARRYARLLTGVEDAFLAEVDRAHESIVVLDGFLRSADRVRLLHKTADEKGWLIEVVYLYMSGFRGTVHSIFRQARRDIAIRKELSRLYWKLRRDVVGLPKVIDEIQRLGIPIQFIDAAKGTTEVQDQLRHQLGIDLQSLPWDREMLRTLASIAPDAWVTGGSHIYRPFFDNRFGPPTDSWDVDIRVWGERRAQEVQMKLDTFAPARRWHVKDALSWSRKELSYEISSVDESLGANALVCVCAGVRWLDKRVDVRWGHPEAEADLRRGLLRPNPRGQTRFAEAKAKKIISLYPAVSAPFLNYKPASIHLTYSEAIARVQSAERGGLRRWGELSLTERNMAARIVQLRGSLDQTPLAVLWPNPAPLPEGNPWLAEDRHFRMWVINQTRSRLPVGGRDEYLAHALLAQTDVAQKPTHQGLDLHVHALHSLLELETDNVPDYRRALRLAMLWHDVGKVWNVSTPGAHPLIGAKKWKEVQGPGLLGVDDREESRITHFIACHDLFGRLERGLWDESYKGAIAPSSVRLALDSLLVPRETMIQIAKAMWLADVGSIPLLRWLRPLAGPLEALVKGVD